MMQCLFRHWFAHRQPARKQRPQLRLEALETREVPAAITVNAGNMLRSINAQVLGANIAMYDYQLNTTQTHDAAAAAGLQMFRLPGGSLSDYWHFNALPSTHNTAAGGTANPGPKTVADLAKFVASVGGNAVVTVDYGAGSPQEGAALLAYLNAQPGNTTVIGTGPEWTYTDLNSSNDPVNGHWNVNTDWKTAGYWASLRAATPLAQDDGLNFLRIGRATPFGLHYFEIGNEEYGSSWEFDAHGQAGSTGAAHDPATYVTFAKQFAGFAKQIDSSIEIGLDTGYVAGNHGTSSVLDWTNLVLRQAALQGFLPGSTAYPMHWFLSDHSYMQGGTVSDANLLLHTVSDPLNDPANPNADPNEPLDWVDRAKAYNTLLQSDLGASAANVELLATEYNSVNGSSTQTTSLVNGLFVADSLGSLSQSGYNGAIFWDLHNGWNTADSTQLTFGTGLYGWRQGSDEGLLGSGSGGPSLPVTGLNVPYPSYFGEQLGSMMLHNGDSAVQVINDTAALSVYAVKEANGHLDLLVINKDRNNPLSGQFQINGFVPNGQAQLWQYGKTQDNAQQASNDGHSALANFTATLNVNGSAFNYSFPSYSMTVMDLAPLQGQAGVNLSNASVAEFRPTGTTVGSLSTIEAGGNHTFTYSLVSGAGSSGNASFKIQGNQLLTGDAFNFAAGSSYSIRVRSTDETNQTFEQTFTITIQDDLALTLSNGTLTVTGTAGNDSFTFAAGSVQHLMSRNGVALAVDAAAVNTINFQGGGGSDMATLQCGSVVTFVNLSPGSGTLRTAGYTVGLSGINNISVSGLDIDTAFLTDTIGNSALVSKPGYSYMSGPGYLNQISGFHTVVANGLPSDTANIVDTIGNAGFVATPTYSYADNSAFITVANGFHTVQATGQPSDTAFLDDTLGGASFVSTPAYSYLASSNFVAVVNGFGTVEAIGQPSDSGNIVDTLGKGSFVGTSLYSYLIDPGFVSLAIGFGSVTAAAQASGDTATLYDNTGAATFVSTQASSYLSGPGYLLQVNGFGSVTAIGTASDTAYLQGSGTSADMFVQASGYSYLYGLAFSSIAEGFGVIHVSPAARH